MKGNYREVQRLLSATCLLFSLADAYAAAIHHHLQFTILPYLASSTKFRKRGMHPKVQDIRMDKKTMVLTPTPGARLLTSLHSGKQPFTSHPLLSINLPTLYPCSQCSFRAMCFSYTDSRIQWHLIKRFLEVYVQDINSITLINCVTSLKKWLQKSVLLCFN